MLVRLEHECKDVCLEQFEVQIFLDLEFGGSRIADEIDQDISVLLLEEVENVGVGEEAIEQFLVVGGCIIV